MSSTFSSVKEQRNTTQIPFEKHNTDPLRVASWDHTDNYSTVFGIPMFKNPTVTLRQYPVVRGVLMIPNGAEFAALMP
jgi:hypothetical protein